MDNQKILIETLEKENRVLNENTTRKYNELQAKYEQEIAKNKTLEKEKKELREQLDTILYSRSYQMMQKIKKIFKKA